MTIYSKIPQQPLQEQQEGAAATARATAVMTTAGRIRAVGSLQTEDPIVAQETLFYDHRGRPIPKLVYYDSNTRRGKKLLPNGELKDCFIKNVRVTIGQFGINASRRNDEIHLDTIKEVVKSRVPGQAQSRLIIDIEDRIRENARQRGRPI